jgi:ABC-type sugar transport system permease subunit
VSWQPYLYVLPAIVFYFILLLYPLARALWMSFHQFTTINGPNKWVGLQNYQETFADPLFWNAFENTVVYSLGLVVIPIILGLLLAVLLDTSIRGNSVFRSLIFSPIVTSLVVASLIFTSVLSTDGVLNSALIFLGVIEEQIAWLGTTTWAMPSVLLMTVWQRTGYYMVILLAGLQSIPDSVYEVAKIQGKSRWATFRHITVPLLKPAIIITVIIGIIDSLKAFATVFVLTNGGPVNSTEIVGTYFYQIIFTNFSFGKGAAVGFILFAVSLVLSGLVVRLQSGGD